MTREDMQWAFWKIVGKHGGETWDSVAINLEKGTILSEIDGQAVDSSKIRLGFVLFANTYILAHGRGRIGTALM